MHSELLDCGDPALQLREVRNDRLRLVFVPSVGGRLLSIEIDGDEVLWRNPAFFDRDFNAVLPRAAWQAIDGTFASWSNVGGSKTWPAPQGWSGAGQWPGPPDNVLDAGIWTWAEWPTSRGLTVEMTSPDDPRTGLRITRRFKIPATGTAFQSEISQRSIGPIPVRWACWEVCQVDATEAAASGGDVVIPVEGEDEPVELGNFVGTMAVERQPGQLVLPLAPVVAKRGVRDAIGSIAWRPKRGPSLTLSTTPESQAEYPDGGSRVQVWMQSPQPRPIAQLSGLQPSAWVVELELLGPLRTLSPGSEARMLICWDVAANQETGQRGSRDFPCP